MSVVYRAHSFSLVWRPSAEWCDEYNVRKLFRLNFPCSLINFFVCVFHSFVHTLIFSLSLMQTHRHSYNLSVCECVYVDLDSLVLLFAKWEDFSLVNMYEWICYVIRPLHVYTVHECFGCRVFSEWTEKQQQQQQQQNKTMECDWERNFHHSLTHNIYIRTRTSTILYSRNILLSFALTLSFSRSSSDKWIVNEIIAMWFECAHAPTINFLCIFWEFHCSRYAICWEHKWVYML